MFFVRIIPKFIFLLIVAYHALSDVRATAQSQLSAMPAAASQYDSNVSTQHGNNGLQIRLPFIDIEMKTEHNLHLMQDRRSQRLYVLHGNELYRMFVNRRHNSLSLVGLLAGVGMQQAEPLGAEMISWRDFLLIVVAFEEHLEIYQIPNAVLNEEAQNGKDPNCNSSNTEATNEKPLNFEPIQELTMLEKCQTLYLIDPQEDRVLLVVSQYLTKGWNKLRTFEWLNTYFDPVEELTVQQINTLHVVGTKQKYFITAGALRHESKTIVTIYELQLPSLHLRNVQVFTVSSRTVYGATFRGRNYIVACSSPQRRCHSFRMKEGQFNVYKRRSSKELAFDRFVAGENFLVGTRQNELRIFTTASLDCYGSFTTNQSEVSFILTHVNELSENFVLVIYQRPTNTLVRVVEIEIAQSDISHMNATTVNDAEDMSLLHQHKHLFEETIGQLRSLLLKRRTAMSVFQKLVKYESKPSLSKLLLERPVRVNAGHINTIKIVGEDLRSPLQLLSRIEDMSRSHRSRRSSDDLDVLSKSTLDIPKLLKVKQLKVENLIYDGNVLEGFHLDNLAKPLPILSIRSDVTTRTLRTQKLLTRSSYRRPRQVVSSLRVRQLNVQRINDKSWSEVYNDLFLRNRDSKIEGRLILQAEAKVRNLWTPRLNNMVVQELFNLEEPQVIRSNILMSRFFVTDLQAERVNGLNFAEDIVFRGRDDFVETPVVMHQISIAENLFLENNTKITRLANRQENDFQQFYTGKVVINGSLILNNLMREDFANTKVLVNGVSFSESELIQHYLLRNEAQAFHRKITFGNAKVTAPSLSTAYLNSHPTHQHLLTNTAPTSSTKPLLLVFMSARVEGDIVCPPSSLLELSKQAVRHGEVANITGVKIFEAPLAVDELLTLELNRLPVSELVTKSQLQQAFNFKGTKSFQNVVVDEIAQVNKMLNTSYLNNLPLKELLNYDYRLDSLYLRHRLQASNVVFHKINGIDFDDVFKRLKINGEQLVLHKDLIIDGNVRFEDNVNVGAINDIEWNAYEQSLVRFNENAVIEGSKHFLSELTITEELQTDLVNGVNLQETFENILSKSKPQLITGYYTFEKLTASNVDVSVINEVPTASFIDTRESEIIIEGDLIVPKLTVYGNISGQLAQPVQFHALTQRLRELPNRDWRNVMVLGNAYWNSSSLIDKTHEDRLEYLYKNAVRSVGNQVISGNVKLRRPLINQMRRETSMLGAVDFELLAKDCLLKNSIVTQVVHAAKSFDRIIFKKTLEANKLLNVELLNQIDIARFNASLYRLSSGAPMIGPLHFQTPPIFKQLNTSGAINGIKTEQVYHDPKLALPPVSMQHLVIDNPLEIGDINDMSLNYLLANRVTKEGDALEVFGSLTFDQLVLNEHALLQSINGIPIDSLIFQRSNQLQAITGKKVIEGNLLLAGPALVMNLNGKNLIDSYQQSVFTAENYHFDTLNIDEATFEGGLVMNSDMTEFGRANLRTAERTNQREKLRAITHELQQIDNLIDKLLKAGKQHLLYLDYDFTMNISWNRPNVSISKSLIYEIKRLSLCERELLQVQLSQSGRNIYLSNLTTNLVQANNDDVHVKAENYCKVKYHKVKSKITITSGNYSMVYGMKKYIENIEIYTPDELVYYILLHAVDLIANRNEVRILRYNSSESSISDWQSLNVGIGKVMKLFPHANHTTLVSASALVNSQPAVSIYNFVPERRKFKLLQVIDGDYDIVELVATQPQRPQLILSCRHCQRIAIYEYIPQAEPSYQIFQLLRLKTLIDKMLIFSLNDGTWYFLVLSEAEQDFYHLYKYSHIEGWQHSTYGYFQRIQLAVPLIHGELSSTGDDLLLLLCGGAGDQKCGVVKAFIQH